MKLTKLELLNFKGLKSFAINLNGDVVIRGDNATGKTTVFDSVCWLLFMRVTIINYNSVKIRIRDP